MRLLEIVLDALGPIGIAVISGALLLIAIEAARWLWG
jgi:hypothetical protein